MADDAWETAATKAYNVAHALVTYADYMAEVHGCPASARSLRDKSAEWFETGVNGVETHATLRL